MRSRANRRRKEARRRPLQLPKVNWARIVTGVAALTFVGATYVSTLWIMDRPIEAVVINGKFERVTADQLEDVLAPHLRHGFVSVDLGKVQRELTAVPWLATASVRRNWPGTLEISVTEEEAAARWGKSGLVNMHGELFVEDASHIPAELPRLTGPAGAESEVTALYFDVERRLEQRGMSATSLTLNRRGAWELELSNGIRVRLGARLVRQRLERFFLALDRVVGPGVGKVNYVDMRYTNGFAIGWKQEGRQPNV